MTESIIVAGNEVAWNGTTVWVNAPTGLCLGRFDIRFGLDIHAADQSKTGRSCLDCRRDPDWSAFVRGVKRHHGITVPERARPDAMIRTSCLRCDTIRYYNRKAPPETQQAVTPVGDVWVCTDEKACLRRCRNKNRRARRRG